MNTARFESSTSELKVTATDLPIEAPSDEESNVTLVRNRPPSSFAKSTEAAADDATPLSRLMLSQERLQSAARNTSPPRRQSAKGLQVTVLTTETTFANQVRAALEGVNDVTIVATSEAAVELAASKRCPILISDTTPTRGTIEPLTAELRTHDPSIVFIVAGKRDQGGMFIGMQSSGAVDGFLLKPATAASTQLVVESATKRYRAASAKQETPAEPTRRSRTRPARNRTQTSTPATEVDERATPTVEAHVPSPSTSQTITPLATTPPPHKPTVPRPTWPVMIAALAAVGAIVWWVMWQRLPDIDPQQVIGQQLSLAESAHRDGRLTGGRDSAAYHLQTVLTLDPGNVVAQRGVERIAMELSRQTQTLMSQRRLADAAGALERLRELKPDYPELPLLDSELKQLQDALVAAHAAPPASEPHAGPQATATAEPERKPVTQPVIEKKQPAPARVANNTPTAAKVAPPVANNVAPRTQQVQPTPTPPAQAPAQVATNIATPAPISAEPAPRAAEPAAVSEPQAPKILKYVPPVYPGEAYARNLEGWVQVSLDVTPSGSVVNARIDDGDKRQLFSRAALAAVKQWKYEPRPQATGETPVTVRLDFKLDSR